MTHQPTFYGDRTSPDFMQSTGRCICGKIWPCTDGFVPLVSPTFSGTVTWSGKRLDLTELIEAARSVLEYNGPTSPPECTCEGCTRINRLRRALPV